MAAGAWLFTATSRLLLLNGGFDLDSDTFKMALFNSSSDLGAGTASYPATNEVSDASTGYTTGGISVVLALTGSTQIKVDIATDPVWTASTDGITAKFAAIYEVAGNVLVYCLLDSTSADVTVTNGNTLTVAANASGVFTLS